MTSRLFLLIALGTFFFQCNSYKTTFLWRNRTIAILPFDTQGLLDEIPRDMELSELQELEATEANILQRDLYRYFLRAMAVNEYPSTFIQNIETTNDILKTNNLSVGDLKSMTSDDIANLLEVDAIVTGYVSGSGGRSASGSGIFNLALESSNRVDVNFSLYKRDGRSPSWVYDKSVNLAAQETVSDASRRIMRDAPKTFPF